MGGNCGITLGYYAYFIHVLLLLIKKFLCDVTVKFWQICIPKKSFFNSMFFGVQIKNLKSVFGGRH